MKITQLEASCPGGRLPEGKAMCAAGGPNWKEMAKSITVRNLAGL